MDPGIGNDNILGQLLTLGICGTNRKDLYIPHSQESKNNSFKSFKKAMEKNEGKFKEQVKKF